MSRPSELRGSRTVMQAESAELAELASRGAKERSKGIEVFSRQKGERLQFQTGSFEYSTGARNKISLVTPEISSEDIQGYLSLNIIFFGVLLVFTAGAGVEAFRFFPDPDLLW